jgi:ligand-binding sensor domain-containing protein
VNKVVDLENLKFPNPKFGFNSAILDKKGNLWFGSFDEGVYLFNGESFTQFTESDGLCTNKVHTILENDLGEIWFGTSSGICTYDGKSFSSIPIPFQDTSSVWLDQVYPVINPNAVHSLIQDKNGGYWIGTAGGGGYYYDGQSFTSFLTDVGRKYDDSLQHNWIPDIAEDLDGNIWFASMSYGGLSCYDGKTLQQFFQKDGLSDDMIRKIMVDKKGTLWLGFNGNRKSALTVFNGDSFTIFPVGESSCHPSIRAIYEDGNGLIWLGGEQGICVLDGPNFHEFLNDNGQPFSGIAFILEDQNQNIWFGGRYGLWQLDGTEVIEITTS